MDSGEVKHMNYKLIGAICVIVACGGTGFMMAGHYISQIRQLADMLIAIDYMESEIQYRATPLPLLCRQTSEQVSGRLKLVFLTLADELEAQIAPDVALCMASVLDKLSITQKMMRSVLTGLGNNLGKFDMSGQLRALQNSHNICSDKLKQLQKEREGRIRSYQTLGLCAGAAIAILFV